MNQIRTDEEIWYIVYMLAQNLLRERQWQSRAKQRALFIVCVLSEMNAVRVAQKETDPPLVSMKTNAKIRQT